MIPIKGIIVSLTELRTIMKEHGYPDLADELDICTNPETGELEVGFTGGDDYLEKWDILNAVLYKKFGFVPTGEHVSSLNSERIVYYCVSK